MNRTVVFVYGVVSYLIFFGTFCYMIVFVGNFGMVVSKTIDSGTPGETTPSIIINIVLLGLFAIQHTIMARIRFKAWWTKFVPEPVERSTFVLATSLLLLLMAWQWQPLPTNVWHVEGGAATVLWVIFFAGWGTVLYASMLIDHFDLFGLRQVWFYWRGQDYAPPVFQMRSLYRWVRHPLLLGFIIAFWATPHMSQGHLLFAVVTTVYIFIGIQVEEGTLLALHGSDYQAYRERVSMLIPFKGPAPADWTPDKPATT